MYIISEHGVSLKSRKLQYHLKRRGKAFNIFGGGAYLAVPLINRKF